MRVSGTTDDGWMPIDLEQVAAAIAALHRSSSSVQELAQVAEPRLPRQRPARPPAEPAADA